MALKTQEEVATDCKEVRDRISQLRLEIEVEKVHLQALQLVCSHPDSYSHTIMGEDSWRCPTCGKAR